jgi:hypothetical protein
MKALFHFDNTRVVYYSLLGIESILSQSVDLEIDQNFVRHLTEHISLNTEEGFLISIL